MLFQYAPLPPPHDLGGTKRNLPFFLELAKRHRLSVLSYGSAEEEKTFRAAYGSKCESVSFVDRARPRYLSGLQRLWLMSTGRSHFRQFFRANMQRAIFSMAELLKPDVIHCCSQMFGCFSFPLDCAVTSDTHEVTFRLLERNAKTTSNVFLKVYYALAAKLGRAEEIRLCRRFDLLITPTEVDCNVWRTVLPEHPVAVISNGVDESFFEYEEMQPEHETLVFTGLFTHRPNYDGLMYFLDRIFPLVLRRAPSARLFVVGKDPPRRLAARACSNVVVTGFVPDVRPYVARAQVFVIPLLSGGGIRGKALEAMAMRRPIVTTSVGVEGIGVRDGESVLVADSPEEFAGAILLLFANRELREQLCARAFEFVKRCHNWRTKGLELDQALRWARARRLKETLGVMDACSFEGGPVQLRINE